ncbi:MAG: flagellar hook-basal body complex protein, partial [Synergistaceae bacterium]|nr:flagellar hook-basal body complex protein [Synergistaceae bacterium]
VFADLMYQSQKTASGPGDGRGGINPAQVGLGVSTAAIETIFTQGASSYTGNTSDMMINGNGFFIYSNGTGSNLYSRAGACVRDANNDLVQSGSGYKLQGYAMSRDPLDDSKFVRDSDLSNINSPLGKKLEPHDTTEVKFQCNLDSRSEAYLPYGYSDIPFNTQCGWDGNPAGTMRVNINGTQCDISVNSLTSATATGTNYMTVTIDDGTGTNKTVTLNMTGINSTTGLPELTIDTTATTLPIQIGPLATSLFNVTYDNNTGRLSIVGDTTATTATPGEVYFQSNLQSAMNYKSFTVNDPNVNGNPSYAILAEFDESVVTSGPNSDLS